MEKKITTYFNFMPKKLYEKIYNKSRKITWTINPQLDGKYSNHLTYQMIDEGLNEKKLKQPYKQLVQFISEKINRKVFPHNMYYNLLVLLPLRLYMLLLLTLHLLPYFIFV